MKQPIARFSEDDQEPAQIGLAASPARHLLHVFPSFGVGGSAVRFATVANHLGECYRHSIAALDGAYDCAARLEPGVAYELVRVEPDTRNLAARLLGLHSRLRAIAP